MRADAITQPRSTIVRLRTLGRLLLSAVVALALVSGFAVAGPAQAAQSTPSGTWVPAGRTPLLTLIAGEGIATTANGSTVTRGVLSIPLSVRLEGFDHIGDLDIAHGDTFDAYQSASSTGAKMFLVTTATGKRIEYRHPLDPGELYNNSFAAVSPDEQWLVGGEFGPQQRLQVFPAPLLNPATPPNGGSLPQAGQITLNEPVSNVQGCDFFSAERLVCAADDADKDVFQVDLPHALDGRPIDGTVEHLFTLPKISKCQGTYETEGIDYDPASKTLRAELISPGDCSVTTVAFSFRWQPDA